jgi:hypothetical protein
MESAQTDIRDSPRAEPRWANVTTVALFLLTLWLPLITSTFIGHTEISETEQRFLAPLPSFGPDWASFPRRLETYYDDHLGLRSALIRHQALIDVGVFGVSPTEKLVIGKRGWLFFGDPNAIAHYRGIAPLTQAELDTWTRILEERRDWLNERGAAFLLVLVPDKHLMYPEYMPDGLPRISEVHPLDQLADYLALHSDVEVLDLREALLAAKEQDRVYHRTDSHWNELGAYAAYRAIHERLRSLVPALADVEPIGVERSRRDEPGMGLARIVGRAAIQHEEVLSATPVDPRSRIKPEHRATYAERVRTLAPIAHGVDDDALPRAIMFRDSFANALIPYLSEDFQRILYVWNRDVDPRIVRVEQPDVVIQQILGRFLGRQPVGISEQRGVQHRAKR